MKTSKIAIGVLALLSLLAVAPVRGATNIVAATWQTQTYHGFDPYYAATINGYKTGATAMLTIVLDNTYNSPIYINGTRLHLGWNQNVSSTPSTTPPILINANTVTSISFSFQIPSTSVATNLDRNGQSYNWYINWTGPPSGPGSGFHPLFTDNSPDGGLGRIYVLSSDQADALTAAQQLPEPIQQATGSGSYSYCGVSFLGVTTGFRTAEASTLCQQSQQQASLALNFYTQADFTDAKNAFQTSTNDWNQALSIDKSTGGNLELGQTVQGWGFLLLGIGALVAGAAGIVYAMKRPRELRGMTAPAAH